MAEEVEIDQKVYDELIAAGKSERIARSKAKAATMRAKKEAAGEKLGPKSEEELAAAQAEAPAAATAEAGGGATAGGGGVAVAERPAVGGMTPEERQRRVAEALAAKSPTGATRVAEGQGETKLQSQKHTHRLLAMVPPTGIQQIRGKQDDKVYTWPHLLSSEFICLLAWTLAIALFSMVVQAPLRALANGNVSPNPNKAPWYFLGLQELLRYFHPMVAGVTIPTVGITLACMIPFLDRNPSNRPESRRIAYVGFTMFLVFAGILAMTGSFFRGPGFNFVWPWVDNLFFEL